MKIKHLYLLVRIELMRQTFKHAINGFFAALKSERNMKIHVTAAFIVIVLGFYLHISIIHWAILLVCIGTVLSAELLNSSIEKIMDLLHPENHEKVKIIKDMAAGAVLVLSVVSAIVGVLIFWTYV